MENPDQGLVRLQSLRETQSNELTTGVSLDPEDEQGNESEPDTLPGSNQGTLEPRTGPPTLALIKFRIQQLYNRRFLLLKMQHFRNKENNNSDRTTEEMTGEDSDDLCELEAIQKELEELRVQEEALQKQEKSSKPSQEDACPTFYKRPFGGIYMLPPMTVTPELSVKTRPVAERPTVVPSQQDAHPTFYKTRPVAERPTGPVVPLDSLGRTPSVTQCPCCREVVFTETHLKVGHSVWTLCFLCSMLGCVAGCCLIPFFTDRTKDVQHHCPQCQALIHTCQPF